MTPFTQWESVPLICGISDAARVLNRSVRDIERDLSNDCMQPAPLPVIGRVGKRRRQWSKAALQAWHAGGYLAFVQDARREQRTGQARHFFGKARGAMAS